MNLYTNSIHAMKEKGGTLTVSLHEVILAKEETSSYLNLSPGPYLELTVSDTGTGIKEILLDKIFQPYFTTKNLSEGTGMGLATVYGSVRDFGGDIKVNSKEGTGTVFKILFPGIGNNLNYETEIIESTFPVPSEKKKILFVDDEEILIFSIKKGLEYLGYNVITAKDGWEGLKAFQKEPEEFDIAIIDNLMPGLNGLELSEKLINIRPDIPIIMCSGNVKPEDYELWRAGITEFLEKPLRIKDLAGVIEKILKKENYSNKCR